MAGKREEPIAGGLLWPILTPIKWLFYTVMLYVIALAVMIFSSLNQAEKPSALTLNLIDYYVGSAYKPAQTLGFADVVYDWVIESPSNLLQKYKSKRPLSQIQKSDASPQSGFYERAGIKLVLQDINELALRMVYLLAIKISFVATAWVLVMGLIFVAMIDGLAERQVRRTEGGHESAVRYHLFKRLAHSYTPVLMGVLFLCCPYMIDASYFLITALLVSVVAIRGQFKFYKKYW